MDSRPFQVFEGSNEMLYSQIAETIFREMKKFKQQNLLEYLKNHPLTARVSDHFKKELNFIVDAVIPQRKLVDLGKILARVISAGYVKTLCDRSEEQTSELQSLMRSSYAVFCLKTKKK